MANDTIAEFERWWEGGAQAFLPVCSDFTVRDIARLAWCAALTSNLMTAKISPSPKTTAALTTEEISQIDWNQDKTAFHDAVSLAKRLGLVILGQMGGKITATRGGNAADGLDVVAQTDTWPKMLSVLKDMEKRGTL